VYCNKEAVFVGVHLLILPQSSIFFVALHLLRLLYSF